MKAFVVSDSHGYKDELLMLIARHKDCDLFIHCGDSELSCDSKWLDSFEVVGGNCDKKGFADEKLIEKDGVKILAVHGHQYNVKSTLMPLKYRAKELGATLVCYGHSHVALTAEDDGMIFLNPGSIKKPRLRTEKTYAIVEGTSKNITISFYTFDGHMLQDLSVRYSLS